MKTIVGWLMQQTFGYRPEDVGVWRDSIHRMSVAIDNLKATLGEADELVRLVRDELVPIVEMSPEANDTTEHLFVIMILVKQQLEALELPGEGEEKR